MDWAFLRSKAHITGTPIAIIRRGNGDQVTTQKNNEEKAVKPRADVTRVGDTLEKLHCLRNQVDGKKVEELCSSSGVMGSLVAPVSASMRHNSPLMNGRFIVGVLS